jgi:hypothetical protein
VFSDKDFGFSYGEALVLLSVVILITYGLYRYFSKLQLSSNSSESNDAIDTTLWEQVSEEIKNGKRIDSLWTRAFSESDGDSNKANARYLKLRFNQIQFENSLSSSHTKVASLPKDSIKVKHSIFDFWNHFNAIGKFALICLLLLVGYGLIGGNMDYFFKPNVTSIQNSTISKSSISIDRGSSWVQSVSELERGIKDRAFPVGVLSAKIISNEFDVFDMPWNTYRSWLPPNLVATVEEKNIWWSSNGKFFIRLFNPSGLNLLAFNFLLTEKCSNGNDVGKKLLINFDLDGYPLVPYSYGIYSTNWPFDYSKVFGDGVICGTVTSVLTTR